MIGGDFLIGAGVKLVSNVVNSWFSNSAEHSRNLLLKDKESIEANIKLLEASNANWITQFSRATTFAAITLTFCWITIYSMYNPEETSILIDVKGGWLSSIFRQPDKVVQEVKSSGIVFDRCFSIMEAVIGAFVMRSKR